MPGFFAAEKGKQAKASVRKGVVTKAHKSVTDNVKSVQQTTQNIERIKATQQLQPQHQPVAEEKAPTPIVRAQSILESEKLTSAYYLEVGSSDEQLVWEHVMKAFKSMQQHDYSQNNENFDAYSMQYFMNTYFLARTRLCRIQTDEEDEGKLFLELNKLEGHSFTFYDQYHQKLSECVSQIGKESAEKVDEEQKVDPFDFLDLSESSSQTIIDGWLADLKVDADLVFDANRVFAALSSLAWNCKNADNKAKLMEHASTIIERSIAILRELNTNQAVTYFASVCVLEFTGEQFESCGWEDVGVFCDVLKEWVKSQSDVESDAQVNKVNKLLVRDIPQSREVVKAVFTILLKLEGVDMQGKPTRKLKQKMKVFDTSEKFQFADIQPETVDSVRKLLKLVK